MLQHKKGFLKAFGNYSLHQKAQITLQSLQQGLQGPIWGKGYRE